MAASPGEGRCGPPCEFVQLKGDGGATSNSTIATSVSEFDYVGTGTRITAASRWPPPGRTWARNRSGGCAVGGVDPRRPQHAAPVRQGARFARRRARHAAGARSCRRHGDARGAPEGCVKLARESAACGTTRRASRSSGRRDAPRARAAGRAFRNVLDQGSGQPAARQGEGRPRHRAEAGGAPDVERMGDDLWMTHDEPTPPNQLSSARSCRRSWRRIATGTTLDASWGTTARASARRSRRLGHPRRALDGDDPAGVATFRADRAALAARCRRRRASRAATCRCSRRAGRRRLLQPEDCTHRRDDRHAREAPTAATQDGRVRRVGAAAPRTRTMSAIGVGAGAAAAPWRATARQVRSRLAACHALSTRRRRWTRNRRRRARRRRRGTKGVSRRRGAARAFEVVRRPGEPRMRARRRRSIGGVGVLRFGRASAAGRRVRLDEDDEGWALSDGATIARPRRNGEPTGTRMGGGSA